MVIQEERFNLESMKKMWITLILVFASWKSFAGLLYTYHQLALMELDQMNTLVQDKVKESKKSDARIVPLKEGFQAIFSRPDNDRMIEKVSGPLRFELQDLGEYQRAVTELMEEALNALKNPKNFKPQAQVTYGIFLENLMADIKPAALAAEGFERGLLKKIAKAKVSLSKPAENDKRVRGFSETKSPSETATLILEEAEKRKKENPPSP